MGHLGTSRASDAAARRPFHRMGALYVVWRARVGLPIAHRRISIMCMRELCRYIYSVTLRFVRSRLQRFRNMGCWLAWSLAWSNAPWFIMYVLSRKPPHKTYASAELTVFSVHSTKWSLFDACPLHIMPSWHWSHRFIVTLGSDHKAKIEDDQIV